MRSPRCTPHCHVTIRSCRHSVTLPRPPTRYVYAMSKAESHHRNIYFAVRVPPLPPGQALLSLAASNLSRPKRLCGGCVKGRVLCCPQRGSFNVLSTEHAFPQVIFRPSAPLPLRRHRHVVSLLLPRSARFTPPLPPPPPPPPPAGDRPGWAPGGLGCGATSPGSPS